MTNDSQSHVPAARSVAIIGGGIAGLCAAVRYQQAHPEARIAVYDAAEQMGGVLQTKHQDGFLVERSADSFLVTEQLPYLGELATQLGLGEQLIEPNRHHRRAMIVRGDKLIPVPQGFQLMAATKLWPLLSSPALPWTAKVRAACERFVRAKKNDGDESITDFISRRIGRDAFEYLAQPLVAGIYSADPDLLSARAALKQYVEFEKQYGSVTRGLKQTTVASSTASGARYSKFKTFSGGMGTLVDALVNSLHAHGVQLLTETRVVKVAGDAHGWSLDIERGSGENRTVESYDKLIVACSAKAAAKLLRPIDGTVASALAEIGSTKVAVVSLGIEKTSLTNPLSAFGVVVPRREQRSIIAASFSSVKFPNRAPNGQELVRVFIGGALQPQLAMLLDDELGSLAISELRSLLKLSKQPRVLDIARWTDASPQYNLGYPNLLSTIRVQVEKQPRLALAGSAYGGVGLPQCVRSGFDAAESIS